MKISLLIAVLIASSPALPADPVFQENFEFGPGVTGREQVGEGAPLKQSGITAADSAWQATGFGTTVVFAPDKGLTLAGKAGNASVLIEVDPELFAKGSPVRAELEVVPGDLWQENPAYPGLWLGFANQESGKDELLANINETADHLALRYAITADPANCYPVVETGVGGEVRSAVEPKKKIPFQPGSVYRMALVFNPADHSYEATVLDTESGETQTVTGTLSLPPVFNILRVDFTSIDPAAATTKPRIKSISLTKE